MGITILLDAGHGKETPGKRSPVWPDGSQLFEYEFNRDICDRIKRKAEALNLSLSVVKLVGESYDVPLYTRIERVKNWNRIMKGNCLLISIHANAGGGTGFEVFTSKGEDKSDLYAVQLVNQLENDFPEIKMRKDTTDGDPDKEADFFMLRKSPCPAMLVENLFMDTESDCRLLMSPEFRDRLAESYVSFIKKII